MRKILLTLMILAFFACPVHGMTQKQVQFVDEYGQAVNMGTSLSLYIYNVGTTTQQTCYLDRSKANAVSQSPSITDNSTNTPIDYTNGLMTFWSTPAGYKLWVTDGVSIRTIDNLNASVTRIYWPSILGHIARGITFSTNSYRTGEGTYLFANGLPIGMTTPGDCQGIKMEFNYGVTPVTTGDGKQAHGLDIKMLMEQPWAFDTKPQNATVRGARIQGWSQDNVSGKVMGAYINARAEGTSKTITGGLTTTGLISIEARTELGTSATITTDRAVGLLCFHNNKTGSVLTGEYAAIQIDQPLHATNGITGDKYAIYIANDHSTINCPFDYAFGFDTNLDLDTVAHYNADISDTGATAANLDGWISVDIDGHQLYIYCYADKPS